MLKTNKRTLILTSLLTLLPLGIGLYAWNQLPDPMTTHFDIHGMANGYSSKPFAIFFLPLFLLGIQWFCIFITFADPRKQNISSKIFTLILWIIPIISLITGLSVYAYNLGYSIPIEISSEILIGLLLLILGNYLPKTKQNYTIGIKLPWTLDNEENWNRTHRLAGFVWVMGGIVILISALLHFHSFYFLFAVLILTIIIPCVYSYWLYTH